MRITNHRGAVGARGLGTLPAVLGRHVEALCYPRHARAQPGANARARAYIADHLSTLGYQVRLQGPHHNVVATPLDPTGPLRFVGAHYDSVPQTPGADDNGSGLAVLLELARAAALGGVPVGLIAFNAEEDGLVGSRDFVAELEHRRGPRPAAIHVLEMVGFTAEHQGSGPLPRFLVGDRRGDFLALIANRGSSILARDTLRRARAQPLAPSTSTLQTCGLERWLPDLLRSDHAPFWDAGIPALMWTDTADLRNPHYHQPTDLPHTLDLEFMARVAVLLMEAVAVPVAPTLSVSGLYAATRRGPSG
ncbi:MAG TPA: M28 family peptidase [Deltaproteobacteria bacterium]|nr:M28 family peptidase [Deltaproteobacteria bacterium]